MNPNRDPNYWAYTRNQRLGLLALLVCLIVAYLITRNFSSASPYGGFDDQDLFAAAAVLRADSNRGADAEPPASFVFDPNTVDRAALISLGLSEKQATAFIRYRAKAPFAEPDDIHRLRTLTPEQKKYLVSLARTAPVEDNRPVSDPRPRSVAAAAFPFDPNTLPKDSLMLLGLTEREANIVLKYRSYRERTFQEAADFARISAVDPSTLERLLPLVTIPPASDTGWSEEGPADSSFTDPIVVDANTAGVETWQSLPGIGPTRARRIVEYRNKLGGFAGLGQLKEVYGLPDSVVEANTDRLTLSPLRKSLFINSATAGELASHPYVDRRLATILVRYRDNHGTFASPEELRAVRALSSETLEALLPYLNFQQ